MPHLPPQQLSRLVRGECPPEEAGRCTLHLAFCLRCHRALLEGYPETGRAWLLEVLRRWRPEADAESLRHLVERLPEHFAALPSTWQHQLTTALAAARELGDNSPAQVRLRVENQQRFRSLGLGVFLLEEAEKAQSPGAKLRHAKVAAVVLESAESQAPAPILADLLARSCLLSGEASLEQGAMESAERSLQKARHLLRRGTRDPHEHLCLERLQTALAWRLGRTEDAVATAKAAGKYLASRIHGRAKTVLRCLTQLALQPPSVEGSPEDVTAGVALRSWAGLPAEQRLLVLGGLRPVATLELVERMLRETRKLFSVEPKLAEEVGRLTRAVAEAMDEEAYPGSKVAATAALARGYVGNALRAQRQFGAAERELEAAWREAEDSPTAHLERAWLLRYRSGLWRDRRKFEAARRAARESRKLFLALGARREGLWMAAAEAIILEEAGKAEQAFAHLERWEAKLTVEAVGWTYFTCVQLLRTLLLARLGRFLEARNLLPALGRLDLRTEGVFKPRVLWIEGLVRQGLGQGQQARLRLREALDALLERGQWLDAALITLDHAQLCLAQGRTGEARLLAQTALPILESHEQNQEVWAAVHLSMAALR